MKKPFFDEKKLALSILEKGWKNNEINIYELTVLAKYYRHIGEKRIRKSISLFCAKHDENFSENIYGEMIDKAIRFSAKYKLKELRDMNIIITENEVEKIKNLPHRIMKIAFVMLCIAKYDKFNRAEINPDKDYAGYYCNYSFRDILRFAKVGISRKEMNEILFLLDGQLGLISSNTFSDSSWRICFADDESDALIVVDDINNLLSFVPHFCLNCGVRIEKNSNRQKYCSYCKAEKQREKVRKYKKKKKDTIRVHSVIMDRDDE